jgi:hypothetical protein
MQPSECAQIVWSLRFRYRPPRLFPGLPQADIAPRRLGFVAPEQGWDHILSLRARSFKAITTATKDTVENNMHRDETKNKKLSYLHFER